MLRKRFTVVISSSMSLLCVSRCMDADFVLVWGMRINLVVPKLTSI